jgi:hypothetical protein
MALTINNLPNYGSDQKTQDAINTRQLHPVEKHRRKHARAGNSHAIEDLPKEADQHRRRLVHFSPKHLTNLSARLPIVERRNG